jgi:hypothetical protein
MNHTLRFGLLLVLEACTVSTQRTANTGALSGGIAVEIERVARKTLGRKAR